MAVRFKSSMTGAGLAIVFLLHPSVSVAQNTSPQGSTSFLVLSALGVTSVTELDGATICLQFGSQAELLVADYFASNGISYEPVLFENVGEGIDLYSAGSCDVFADESARIEQVRQLMAAPNDHIVLPESTGQTFPAQGVPAPAPVAPTPVPAAPAK